MQFSTTDSDTETRLEDRPQRMMRFNIRRPESKDEILRTKDKYVNADLNWKKKKKIQCWSNENLMRNLIENNEKEKKPLKCTRPFQHWETLWESVHNSHGNHFSDPNFFFMQNAWDPPMFCCFMRCWKSIAHASDPYLNPYIFNSNTLQLHSINNSVSNK